MQASTGGPSTVRRESSITCLRSLHSERPCSAGERYKRTGAQDGHWEKCKAHAAGGSGALPAEVVLGRCLKDEVGFPELERRQRGAGCCRQLLGGRGGRTRCALPTASGRSRKRLGTPCFMSAEPPTCQLTPAVGRTHGAQPAAWAQSRPGPLGSKTCKLRQLLTWPHSCFFTVKRGKCYTFISELMNRRHCM